MGVQVDTISVGIQTETEWGNYNYISVPQPPVSNASNAAQTSTGSGPNTTNKQRNSIGGGERASKKQGQQGADNQSAALADRNDDGMEVEK